MIDQMEEGFVYELDSKSIYNISFLRLGDLFPSKWIGAIEIQAHFDINPNENPFKTLAFDHSLTFDF